MPLFIRSTLSQLFLTTVVKVAVVSVVAVYGVRTDLLIDDIPIVHLVLSIDF